jgi:hypothetical protein
LVIESESGMRTLPPNTGTIPDVVVDVDLTPPVVRLLGIQPSAAANKVRIEWQTTDKHPKKEGTKLEYSTDGRTWQRIEGFDEAKATRTVKVNSDLVMVTQHYDWTIPQGLPHQLMLRVTARDMAGNSGVAELPQKVSLDLVVPEGKIVNVQFPTAIEQGPQPREVFVFPDAKWFIY